MPRGRPIARVTSEIDIVPIREALADISAEYNEAIMGLPTIAQAWQSAPSITPLLRLATLAQRMAERYLAGKSGLALENDAREVRNLWDTLPDEIRTLL